MSEWGNLKLLRKVNSVYILVILQRLKLFRFQNLFEMEVNYSESRKMCKLCKAPVCEKKKYKRHYSNFHDPSNPELCDIEDCNCRFKNKHSLSYHKTHDHKQPEANATLPDGEKMIWVEKVVAVHDNSFVGVYVGESKYYYATKAASHRDKEGSECIIS